MNTIQNLPSSTHSLVLSGVTILLFVFWDHPNLHTTWGSAIRWTTAFLCGVQSLAAFTRGLRELLEDFQRWFP